MKKMLKKQLALNSETLRSLSADLGKVVGGATSVGEFCVSLGGGTSCCSIYSKCANLCVL
jgi:hypothetical protein